jgi:hypothetical protein
MSVPAEPEASALPAGFPPCPPMPAVEPQKLSLRTVYHYGGVIHADHNVGWQRLRGDQGTSFVLVKEAALGTRVIDRFPLTKEGWTQAWHSLVLLDLASAQEILETQALRRTALPAEIERLNADTLARLSAIYLGGYGFSYALQPRVSYDLRFLPESIGIYLTGKWSQLAEIAYADVQAVDIGGPGLVRSGGGFAGGGFGVAGAAEGMAVAAVLNAVTTKVRVKTVVRIETAASEIFMLHAELAPDALRIQLSQPLGIIRAAQSARSADVSSPASGAAAVVEQLGRLAQMLDAGLLTREEFDRLKGDLLGGS